MSVVYRVCHITEHVRTLYRDVFEGTHENPELMWNDEARERVCSTVRQMKDEYVAATSFVVFLLSSSR